MLCPYCGRFSTTDTTVCGQCGKLLPRERTMETGVRAIRQGKRAREAAAAGVDPASAREGDEGRLYVDAASGGEPIYAAPEVFDANGEPVSGGDLYRRLSRINEESHEARPPLKPVRRRTVQKRSVNWAMVFLVSAIMVVLLLVGGLVFLLRTQPGQKIMARRGFDVNASSTLWEVGDECMNVGDIDEAIAYYEKAWAMDEEAEEINVPYLLELGSAYEAAGRLQDAEALYVHIYTDIAPSAPDAYTNAIRIMLNDGRETEAAELVTLAYKNTKNATFSSQRANLLPSPPSVNITAGYYEQVKMLTLTADEGCTIRYTFDSEAVLPYGGQLYTGPITLDEGSYPLRAVAVNEAETLVSDELSATYTISMPSPISPYPSLATGTYKQRQRVRLFQNIERSRDPNVVIYYTIDGSTPNADSPIYDQDKNEGILLHGGKYVLKAVSVNEYGKASNTLEVEYKIEAKPYPKDAYSTADTANGLRLNQTTYTTFTDAYGQPRSTESIERKGFEGQVTKCTYSWGYAVFHNVRGNNVLIELYFTNSTFKGPRSTAIGNTLDAVVEKFRDMGQVASASGNRGLYSNDSGVGRIYVNKNGTTREDELEIIYADQPEDAKIVRYWCWAGNETKWSLDYICDKSGTVVAIDMLYIP